MQQDLESSLRQKTLHSDHLEQRLVIEEQMSEDRKQAIELLEQQVLELQSQLMEMQSVPPGVTTQASGGEQVSKHTAGLLQNHKTVCTWC